PNYLWTKGQRFFDMEEQGKQQQSAWLMAATFVMLLMSALFESVLLPWAVIITVPFSFFGVWWLFWITGTQFGIMAAIGVIILIGVVVNNAIVLVDRINQLRAEGLPRNDAVAIGAHQRFRPMMMTALTTILGLMPMAVGNTNLFGIPYAPLGRALIGGLITSTLLTPIMVPVLYTYLDDLRGKFQKLKLTPILNN
ncbi:MAG: efflux RND transporter permease subunit, partial [bacterium]